MIIFLRDASSPFKYNILKWRRRCGKQATKDVISPKYENVVDRITAWRDEKRNPWRNLYFTKVDPV